MNSRSRKKKPLPPLCGQIGPGDGVDPREDVRHRSVRQADRKTLQLCRQVMQTLRYVLSAECGDDLLRGLDVVRVDPAPDASRLLVTVTSLDKVGQGTAAEVRERLGQRSGFFRSEVARAISRRKTPVLSFQFLRVFDDDSGAKEANDE